MFYAWQYWQSLATHYAADMNLEALRRQNLVPVRPERRLCNMLRFTPRVAVFKRWPE